jgi:hypothetical protein
VPFGLLGIESAIDYLPKIGSSLSWNKEKRTGRSLESPSLPSVQGCYLLQSISYERQYRTL